MAVVVRNESIKPWVFDGSSGRRSVPAGEIAVISDEEWGSVITAKRGPGAMNPLWPVEATSDILKTNFEYAQVGAIFEIKYAGWAVQTSLDTDAVWTIKFFQYQTYASDNKITSLQVLTNVAWSNRNSLPWT